MSKRHKGKSKKMKKKVKKKSHNFMELKRKKKAFMALNITSYLSLKYLEKNYARKNIKMIKMKLQEKKGRPY